MTAKTALASHRAVKTLHVLEEPLAHFSKLKQNSLARAVVKAPKSTHITPILKFLHWLKVNDRIE